MPFSSVVFSGQPLPDGTAPPAPVPMHAMQVAAEAEFARLAAACMSGDPAARPTFPDLWEQVTGLVHSHLIHFLAGTPGRSCSVSLLPPPDPVSPSHKPGPTLPCAPHPAPAARNRAPWTPASHVFWPVSLYTLWRHSLWRAVLALRRCIACGRPWSRSSTPTWPLPEAWAMMGCVEKTGKELQLCFSNARVIKRGLLGPWPASASALGLTLTLAMAASVVGSRLWEPCTAPVHPFSCTYSPPHFFLSNLAGDARCMGPPALRVFQHWV